MRALTAETVLATFQAVCEQKHVCPPIPQRPLKTLTVLTVDRLVALAYPRMRGLKLYANSVMGVRIKHARHAPSESMVDVAVFAGDADPYDPLFTAESEGYGGHRIHEHSTSGDSDYLWDLYKLLQVPSPIRLFVARVRTASLPVLGKRTARLVSVYSNTLREGDRIFSLLLPTAGAHYPKVTARGWVKRDRRIVELPHAAWGNG